VSIGELHETDETAGGDNGGPEKQGESAGKFCAEGQGGAIVPGSEIAKSGELKNERLHAGEKNQKQFQAERGIVVELHGLGGKEKDSGEDLEGEGGPDPRKQPASEIGNTRAAKEPAKKPQIESGDRDKEHGHAEKVGGFNRGKEPEGLADAGADVGLLEPLAEGESVPGGYGAPRRERPSGRMILPSDI